MRERQIDPIKKLKWERMITKKLKQERDRDSVKERERVIIKMLK